MGQNVRTIKGRINNVRDIGQITKAMNAIAMTKVTRMKRRLGHTRPYLEDLSAFAGRLMGRTASEDVPHPLCVPNGSSAHAVFVLNADRGLCGRYKGDLNRESERLLTSLGDDAQLIVGGEKARTYFARRGVSSIRTYVHVYDKPTEQGAARIANELMDFYEQGMVGKIDLVYMRFSSDLTQDLVIEPFLPVAVSPAPNDDLIDPDADRMLDVAVRLLLRGSLFAAMIETKTSEDALRRQAMKAATDNAEDLVKALTRTYNKARQHAITREIADIIGGAEALRE